MKNCIKILSLILGVFLFFALSCNGDDSETQEGATTSDAECEGLTQDACDLLKDPDLSEDIKEWVRASAVIPEPDTTADLIMKAYDEGEIDDTMLNVYLIYALYYPEKVPAEYVGAEIGEREAEGIANPVTWWLKAYFNTLSAELQEELRPLILSPDDPQSYFNIYKGVGKAATKADGVETKKILTTADGKTKIHYLPAQEHMAQVVKEAAEKAWLMFKDLLGVEPPAGHVYFSNTMKHNGTGGLAFYSEDNTVAYCEVKLSNAPKSKNVTDDNYLRGTMVHELFHCFHHQLQYNWGNVEVFNNWQKAPDFWWLLEATATWAQDYVFPEGNSEMWDLLKYFYSTTDDFLSTKKSRHYGMYLWFFYLRQLLSDDPAVIAHTLFLSVPQTLSSDDKTVRIASMDAANQKTDFYDAFADFALYNVNYKEPFHWYKDIPEFPMKSKTYCGGQCAPYGKSLKIFKDNVIQKKGESINLKPGAVRYDFHIFSRPVRKVLFTLSSLEANPALRRQAAVFKTDGSWEMLGDWSKEEEKEFCLTKERIKAIMIIVSNADLLSPATIDYNYETFHDCERVGFTRVRRVQEGGSTNFDAEEQVELDAETGAYVLVHRSITYHSTDEPPGMDADNFTSMICSGSLTETYMVDDGIKKFWEDEDGTGWHFDAYPPPNNPDWVTCTTKGAVMGVTFETEGPGSPEVWPLIDLTSSEVLEDRILGSREASFGTAHGYLDFEYSFSSASNQ